MLVIETVFDWFRLHGERVSDGHPTASHDSQRSLVVGWEDLTTGEWFVVRLVDVKVQMSDPDKLHELVQAHGAVAMTGWVIEAAERSRDQPWHTLGLDFWKAREIIKTSTNRKAFFGLSGTA